MQQQVAPVLEQREYQTIGARATLLSKRRILSRHPDFIILGAAQGTTPQIKNNVYFLGET